MISTTARSSIATARALLLAALIIGAVVRLGSALTDDGIFWPDEIYQSLEPGHALAFGYGLLPWEFVDGARNWTLSGLIAGVMKLCAGLGLDQSTQYLGIIRTLFVAMAVATGWAVWRMARALGADDWSAAIGALLQMTAAPAIYFAHRAMAENASALPVALGTWLTLDRTSSSRRVAAGASLLGLAALLRLQCALFAVGALAVLLIARRWRHAAIAGVVLIVWAVFYGAIDAVAWHGLSGARFGGWFYSALTYIRFNAIEGRASDWGVSPAGFYLRTFFLSMPAVATTIAIGTALAVRRAPALVAIAVGFSLAHSAIPHKEFRFLLPAWPLLFAAAAIGFSTVSQRWRPGLLAAAGVVAITSLGSYRSLTFGDFGGPQATPDRSAWDYAGPVNRLLQTAGMRSDVCGIRVDAMPLVLTGGMTYLHKKARLYQMGEPNRGQYNYVIMFAREGADVVAREDMLELVRVADRCTTRDPDYQWKLP